MKIYISERLKPFSHRPGICCMIPGTPFEVEAFPTLVRIYDLTHMERREVKKFEFDLIGPVRNFTVMQDLERGCVTVFGEGFPPVHILPDLTLMTKKHAPALLFQSPRLSLGMHKKQEWDSIKERLDLREIFPIWLRLGNLLDLPPCRVEGGMFTLLDDCRQAIESGHPERIALPFEKLLLAGFRGLLVPRLEDEEFQGLLAAGGGSASPLFLLSEGARLIASLFYRAQGNHVHVLPALPPQFFAGRLLGIPLDSALMELEWSKKEIRKVALDAQKDAELILKFQPDVKSFRIRQSLQDKGRRISCGMPLAIKSGSLYLLDQFKH